jgi:hypothetical protein
MNIQYSIINATLAGIQYFYVSVAKATVIVVTIGLLYVRTVRGGQMTVELLMHE